MCREKGLASYSVGGCQPCAALGSRPLCQAENGVRRGSWVWMDAEDTAGPFPSQEDRLSAKETCAMRAWGYPAGRNSAGGRLRRSLVLEEWKEISSSPK